LDSILNSVKKNLGLDASYLAFDDDVIMNINSVFGTLNQLGIGPADGFAIEDDSAVWDDFLAGDVKLNSVKMYVYLRVRLAFDPPTTSYHISAVNDQIRELEWRLNTYREEASWVSPITPAISE
jgi:hypothetical protein